MGRPGAPTQWKDAFATEVTPIATFAALGARRCAQELADLSSQVLRLFARPILRQHNEGSPVSFAMQALQNRVRRGLHIFAEALGARAAPLLASNYPSESVHDMAPIPPATTAARISGCRRAKNGRPRAICHRWRARAACRLGSSYTHHAAPSSQSLLSSVLATNALSQNGYGPIDDIYILILKNNFNLYLFINCYNNFKGYTNI